MKLSIIVPVYNMVAGGKLENCLNSLVNQEVEDMEIIAVDDKSTDDSLQMLYRYSEQYGERFITIASPENKRQGGAKNLGLARAKGDWVGFIDSDDWIAPDMFSKLLKKAEETGADVVGCDYLLTEEIGRESGKVIPNNTADQTGVLGDAQYKALLEDLKNEPHFEEVKGIRYKYFSLKEKIVLFHIKHKLWWILWRIYKKRSC